MNNNKQSSVEWLIDQMLKQGYFDGNKPLTFTNLDHLQERAEARHKKELISFALKYGTLVITQRTVVNAEEVYNETYGGNK